MPASRARSTGRGKPAVAVVVSRYNGSVTERLLRGAREAHARRGAGRIDVIDVPGSFELPAVCLAAAKSGRYDGVLALGCLIRGQTSHDQVIAHAVGGALAQVSLRTGVPVSFGVLTVANVRQALDRAGGSRGNRGAQAMEALLGAVEAVRAAGRGRAYVLPGASHDKAAPSRRRRA